MAPVSMIYDYRLDDAMPTRAFELCPDFLRALEKQASLMETSCFTGACPSREQDAIVCPSGFWGFRHSIGLPVSTGNELDAAVHIMVDF